MWINVVQCGSMRLIWIRPKWINVVQGGSPRECKGDSLELKPEYVYNVERDPHSGPFKFRGGRLSSETKSMCKSEQRRAQPLTSEPT